MERLPDLIWTDVCNARWQAEAALRKARSECFRALNMAARYYQSEGYEGNAARMRAASHFPKAFLDSLDIDARYR